MEMTRPDESRATLAGDVVLVVVGGAASVWVGRGGWSAAVLGWMLATVAAAASLALRVLPQRPATATVLSGVLAAASLASFVSFGVWIFS